MIENIKNPRWFNADKTAIVVDCTLETVRGADGSLTPLTHVAMPDTDTEPMFRRLRDGEFGAVAEYVTPQPPPKPPIQLVANVARLRRVEAAYGGSEKRTSLYGYLGQVNALVAAGSATKEQSADLAVLLSAAAWEQAMLDFAASLVKAGDSANIDAASWPTMSKTDTAALTALATAS